MPAQHVCNAATTATQGAWTITFIVLVLVLVAVVVVFMPQCPSKYLLFQRFPFGLVVLQAALLWSARIHRLCAAIYMLHSPLFYLVRVASASFPAPAATTLSSHVPGLS